ncbi:anti-sigma-28 factor, FlgM family [Paenibacillus sp. UNCCL117]|uniref:flagellar biosynthesis anti-sigma factor FlgM n=1 Tax=unclassified Paenibacillus TaxID=185978 RepID=UPI00088DD7EB|nr:MULTISPECIES: flagellar biosynthesis anti-sigma factor FlgM [unclassified Paenibacillus]SDE35162.1 anti-sigma-28 factor, FlgM family [Paenibacillus sp. cl123]SFW64450.1 anti-sigma-28 factor, FlgM family [Paenibacillus sp. UNCCL117]
MKINRTDQVGSVNPYKKAQEAINTPGPNKKRAKDQVEISSEAKELLSSLGGTHALNSKERIDELKHSVQSGTYQVDSRKLAEKLFPFLK